MIQRNLRLKLVIGMLVSLSFAAPGQAKNVKVAIPSRDLTAIAFIVAAEKGYYREEGLDVELILMSAPIATLALVGGNVDFSVVGSPSPLSLPHLLSSSLLDLLQAGDPRGARAPRQDSRHLRHRERPLLFTARGPEEARAGGRP